MDVIEECRGLEEDERVRKIDMSREMEKTLLFEELNWRQKSRALWLKEGDKNTNFFLRVANSHRKFNQVNSLKINGEISKNPTEIQEHKSSFTTICTLRIVLGGQGWRVYLFYPLMRMKVFC
jgi:hypothetical protein